MAVGLRMPGRAPSRLTGLAVAMAVIVVVGVAMALLRPAAPGDSPQPGGQVVLAAQPAVAALEPRPAVVMQAGEAGRVTSAVAASSPACPFQQLEITLAGAAAQRACLDSTRVQQNGGVRSYVAAGSGTAGWALQVDVAGGSVIKVALKGAEWGRFVCEGDACVGLALGSHDARGLRSITLNRLALGTAEVSGRLSVPADDLLPGLACTGPSVMMNSPDGSARRFCGQGGAGVEITDDGLRRYRFDDAEGRTLTIAVDAERRVTGVEYGTLACAGSGCAGASMVALAPESELSERSFHFGRTALVAAGAPPGAAGVSAASRHAGLPQLLLEGSLTMPSQE